ncbi:hypothetical protein [Nocardia seriolae]|uniref:Uncharacterized protein n=1 Tax=Nocardia seriolae TaxID=37332 RepID=A0ABC9YQC8_9NOCA|nr:hypothetical protein [Nocardia seriolae]APA97390.1 hypothetical protein NS506_03338 [Nocardia seriolae]WKY50465.1 hypothetical protein Q5P07_26070 [Nocardia seriolae]BAW05680.1 conserved hypothetical protein [Nocardia seriolae]BEK86978.1 hypothetical protein NSERKGN1266_29290 [Nocardia seriolae]BEK97245.1 hypothetical protein NSER024013_51510 [Nocardia seriolae]
MSLFHHLVRVAGAVGVCAVLAAAGPATLAGPASAAPADPVRNGSGDPVRIAPAAPATKDAAAALAAITTLGNAFAGSDTAAPSDWLSAYGQTVNGLQALGIQPFLYPTAAPFCLGGTTLGLAPAVAGTVPGPWPRYAISIPGLDLSAVKAGQTMFAFVPYGINPDGADTSGMQVAWFNLTTGRGGLVPMGPLSQVLNAMIPPQVPNELRPMVEQAVRDYFTAALPSGGVRAVPVNTGSGTVLAAMFGTVRNGATTCLFLPTVGMTPVP